MITILIFYSKHALEKMNSLGLERIDIENTILKGMKWKEENSNKWRANMSGTECVFIKEDANVFVITVYKN